MMRPRLDMNAVVGTHDIVLLTLDTLRYDVAADLWRQGKTPRLSALLPEQGWEERHAPGNFTYPSHQAIFAGFLPTPCGPGPHPRLFAMSFAGSESIAEQTCVFESATFVQGLQSRGYHTVCIGGTGFFNKQTPLGRVLPGMFAESHWSPELGVTHPESTANQFAQATESLAALTKSQRAFLFINVSALHQPNYFYVPDRVAAQGDDLHSHGAALEYVDTQLPTLLKALRLRGPSLLIICSDHGTAYGEGGQQGHRFAHEVVWTVPYMHTVVPGDSES